MPLRKTAISAVLLFAVLGTLVFSVDLAEILNRARLLSAPTLTVVLAALLANCFAAALRLKIISSDIGTPVTFRQAMAAVSGGNLAGAAFFQIAGQLMARGAILAKSGIPFASVAVMTLYERFLAASVSALLALAGAYYVFGYVYLDQRSGGEELIKIVAGLLAAAVAGGLVGYGRIAAQAAAPLITRNFAWRFLRMIILSLLVQLPMMAAYVCAAMAVSPQTPAADLAAASAIVMFAASVPISLAGWGVREMSAVLALGAIGVPVVDAVLAAVMVGAGSMLVMAVIAAVSVTRLLASGTGMVPQQVAHVDYGAALSWMLPLAAATLVLFQVYVPATSETLLNVNLADPLAVLGGSLMILNAYRGRQLPQWRLPSLNHAVAAATLALTVSLLVGISDFGWTTWAWLNRYLGWFVLLAFAATGALIVKEGGTAALQILLSTFAAASCAVVGIEIAMPILKYAAYDFAMGLNPFAIRGFAQNRNAFAFQILMALVCALAVKRGVVLRVTLLSVLTAGLVMTGSRAGWVAGLLLLGTALYMDACRLRELALTAAAAMVIVFVAIAPGFWTGLYNFDPPTAKADARPDSMAALKQVVAAGTPAALPSAAISIASALPNNLVIPAIDVSNERMTSLMVGLSMFQDHPIFGAGLGAFRNQNIMAANGLPLLIHSTPVWLLAELGMLGLLAFAIPALALFWTELRRPDPDVSSMLIVLLLVAFAVMSAPHEMLYQRTFWLLLGAGLATVPTPMRR
jgi:hypothetical protein